MGKILVCASQDSTRESFKEILGDKYDMILTEDLDYCQTIIKEAEISHFFLNTDDQDEVKIKEIISNNPTVKFIVIADKPADGKFDDLPKEIKVASLIKPLKSESILSVLECF